MGTWAALVEGCGCDDIFEARVQAPKKHAVENQSNGELPCSSDAAAVAAAEQRGANHGHAQRSRWGRGGRWSEDRRSSADCDNKNRCLRR